MTTPEILLTIVFGFAINETCDLSPWLARHIVRLAARLRYDDTARGRARGEDLAAYIETRPGKLLKLGAAVCFLAVGSVAVVCRGLRAIAGRISARNRAEEARRNARISQSRLIKGISVGCAIGAGINGTVAVVSAVTTMITGGITGSAAVVVFALGLGSWAIGILLCSSVVSSVRTRRRPQGRRPGA